MSAWAAGQDQLKGLRGPLLALLLEVGEPTHGYVLARRLRERLEPAVRVELRAVYRMLDDLEGYGLIAGERADENRGGRPPKTSYWPTELARPALEEWFAAPVFDDGAKADILIRITMSKPSDAPLLLNALQAMEARCIELVKERHTAGPDDVGLVSTWEGMCESAVPLWAKKHAEADLQWIAFTRDWIRDYVSRSRTGRR